MATTERFNVVHFFENGTYVYVLRDASAEDAVHMARFFVLSEEARLGLVRRVIITDGGDFTVFDWRFGEGIVWPTKELLSGTNGGCYV